MWIDPNRGGLEIIIKEDQKSLYERGLTFSLIDNNEKSFPVPLLSIFFYYFFTYINNC